MWNYPDEDAFWESRRVEMESMFYGTENEPEEKSIYVDEELDELEAEYGCSMDELPEGDLMDIVFKTTGEVPTEARYNARLYEIEYMIEREGGTW